MSSRSTESPSPGRRNSPESYQSAVKDIEQEKQVVAALKRLSIGHLMNHDPDLPVSDPEFRLIHDQDHHDDSTFSGDSLSLSKTPSPQTSDSSKLVLLLNKESHEIYRNDPSNTSNRRSRLYDLGFENAQYEPYSGEEPLGADLLWVPANLHPEVNPQQFKSHVKNTIDELLERKLSRSNSANRSKRSSLSLSTTDREQLSRAIEGSKSTKEPDFEVKERYSNPSLRELSSELEVLSRMAGMDSNDAVTLARSLSTSSLGYTEVEKLAFDELGSPTRSSSTSHLAELMDFGVEETSPTAHKSYAISNQMMGQPPVYQGYPHQSHLRRASGPHISQSRQSFGNSGQGAGYRPQNRPQPGDDFALKRSRRLDYRKGPATTPTQLGSQLQSSKAEKLAELRHNLSGTSTPVSSTSEDHLTVKNSSRSTARSSVQSINPRSSQILFSYKSPASSTSPSPSPSPSRSHQSAPMQTARVSPYGSAAISSSASLKNQLHHSKYGQQKISSKHMGNQPSSKHRGHNAYQSDQDRSSRRPSSGSVHPMEYQRSSKPTHHAAQGQYSQRQRQVFPQDYNVPHNHQSKPQSKPMHPALSIKQQQQQQYMRGGQPETVQHKSHSLVPIMGHPIAGQPVVGHLVSGQPVGIQPVYRQRQYSGEEVHGNTHFYGSSRSAISKRDKSKELNQNLDLLRNEINEFKESLSKADPKAESIKDVQPVKEVLTEGAQEKVTDFSFDLSSHDVSYEDSLGMELDVLKEINTEKPSSSRVSPNSRPKETRVATSNVSTLSLETDKELLKSLGSTEPPPQAQLEQVHAQLLKESINEENINGHLPSRSASTTATTQEKKSVYDEVKSILTTPQEDERKSEENKQILLSGSKFEEPIPESVDPAVDVSTKIDSKIKKKKSFSSLTNRSDSEKKKSARKTWLWSKDRSASTSHTPEEKSEFSFPSRSVSSPEITSNKREAPQLKDESSEKKNVIAKLFKKKRSNSVSSDRSFSQSSPPPLLSESIETQDSSAAESASRPSLKSKPSRESRKEVQLELKSPTNETKHSDFKARKKDVAKTEDSKNTEEQTVTSRIKNKLKQIGKSHEEKSEQAIEESISGIDEEESKEAVKPQSTLEVQEKLKKSIKRTSKPNQPIKFTDSAFGFPLPPPSHSTLVMIDYRFPVHVERAIYRLSHLKLANPKRSLREQVLLSNFMYAYLNLVDHTLHLEQQMELEDALELPEPDIDMFATDEADTEFESDDDLDDSAFDSIKIDLDVQDTQQITV